MWPIKHPKTSKNDLRVTKTPVKSLWSPWKTHQKVASIISIIQQPWKFPISSSQFAPRSASPKCVVWPSMVAARPSMPLRMASHVAKVSVQCGSPAEVARRPGRTNWSRGSRGSRGDLGETWGNPRYAEMVISGSEMVLNHPKYLETNWILEHSGISIYMHQALPPPPSPPPHMGWVPYTGPIWDLPPPPLWCGGGVALSPSPPCGVVDGSHILVPYEIFPLPPLWCGGGVALSPSPPCGVVDGSHILVPYEIFPLPPLWCGGGVALSPSPPCGVVGVWYGMVGMYGVYGRSGMVCLVCMVGMVCMAWVVGIVWMVGMVCKSVGYGMFDMTVCMVCMVCMVTMMGMEYVLSKVGMVCMACMLAIVCMLLYVW